MFAVTNQIMFASYKCRGQGASRVGPNGEGEGEIEYQRVKDGHPDRKIKRGR
jgi:hypothetical protein